MNTKNREKTLVLVAIVCVFALIGDKMILTPLLNAWDENAVQIESLQSSLHKGSLLLTREREIRKRWREMQRDAFPNDISQSENLVMKSVNQWVQNSRVTLSSFKPQWRQDEEEYMTLVCRAVTQGSMRDIARFIYEMEKDPLALKVENVEITTRDKTGNVLTLAIRFSGLRLLEERESQ
jgi:Tfp pilus assembly protein PilO